MICCDFKAGIGTSSRFFSIGREKYTVGILVLNNFGSMIAVLATDLPLSPSQIQRISKRAALGIGRVGSYASHGSGEIVIGFSTANIIKHGQKNYRYNMNIVSDQYIRPAYQAVIECTEEAIINSITCAEDMIGVDNNYVPCINLELLKEIITSYYQLTIKFGDN